VAPSDGTAAAMVPVSARTAARLDFLNSMTRSTSTRVLGLLGGSLTAQAARLLADEATDGRVALPQRTLAAMLGVQRPSLNKVLKELERDGLIRIGYSAIDILDPPKLARRGL